MTLSDKDILYHLDTVGPYTIDELVVPIGSGKFGVCRDASPEVAARVVREMPGAFNYQWAFDFCDYHSCNDYDNIDVLLEELLKKTSCTQEQRDELLLTFGSEKLTAPILKREEEERQRQTAAGAGAKDRSFGMLAIGTVLGLGALDAFAGGDPVEAGEPEFQDFNHAWGTNNDHDWEADGDTRWDSHDRGSRMGKI